MLINPVTPASAAAAIRSDAELAWLVPAQVSAIVLEHAEDDGDGKTGAAALNDGDAAARAAAQAAQCPSGRIDVKA